MGAIFTSSLSISLFLLLISSINVYIILRFVKQRKHNANTILAENKQLSFIAKAAKRKTNALKSICEADKEKGLRLQVAKQLDELVAEYDSGLITFPDYCKRLNKLLAMMA